MRRQPHNDNDSGIGVGSNSSEHSNAAEVISHTSANEDDDYEVNARSEEDDEEGEKEKGNRDEDNNCSTHFSHSDTGDRSPSKPPMCSFAIPPPPVREEDEEMCVEKVNKHNSNKLSTEDNKAGDSGKEGEDEVIVDADSASTTGTLQSITSKGLLQRRQQRRSFADDNLPINCSNNSSTSQSEPVNINSKTSSSSASAHILNGTTDLESGNNCLDTQHNDNDSSDTDGQQESAIGDYRHHKHRLTKETAMNNCCPANMEKGGDDDADAPEMQVSQTTEPEESHLPTLRLDLDENDEVDEDEDDQRGDDFDPAEVLKRMKVELKEDFDDEEEDEEMAMDDCASNLMMSTHHQQQQQHQPPPLQHENRLHYPRTNKSFHHQSTKQSSGGHSKGGRGSITSGNIFDGAGSSAANAAALAAAAFDHNATMEYFRKIFTGTLQSSTEAAAASPDSEASKSQMAAFTAAAAAAAAALTSCNSDSNSRISSLSGGSSAHDQENKRAQLIQALLLKQLNGGGGADIDSSELSSYLFGQQSLPNHKGHSHSLSSSVASLMQRQQQANPQAVDDPQQRYCTSCNIQFISAKTFKVSVHFLSYVYRKFFKLVEHVAPVANNRARLPSRITIM